MRALAASLLLLPLLAGCLQLPGAAVETAALAYPPDAVFDTTGPWSRTLAPGSHSLLPVEVLEMPSFDGKRIHMGIFRPDVPDGTRVPVIVDAGPYYLDGDEGADSATTRRLGGFLIETFVPHGYAVAQVSIRGTGLSEGCVDYMGEAEQRDLDAVVTFLAEQSWSNGNVGMIGRSYDGSTPWEAAMFGNPALKTIVPISGITDLQQLHYRNGSSEFRSLILGHHYYTYGATEAGLPPFNDGVAPEDDATRARRIACAQGPQHAPMGAVGYATGGGQLGVPGPVESYWAQRSFTARVLENYQGSIFYIHGLQDWNVVPSQGVDVYNAFAGEKKALLGQWAHNYPDRPKEHEHVRWDWAEVLLRWFDRELKGLDVDTGPAVEVEDHRGNWRVEPQNAWPPTDATWIRLLPSVNGSSYVLVEREAQGSATVLAPAPLALVGADAPTQARVLRFEGEPLAADTRISGQPRLHITVKSPTAGGQIWAELIEVPAEGEPLFLGRAQMDLRYAEGGKVPRAYTPNTAVVAKMEFFPMDVRVLAGSRLVLLLTGEPDGIDPLANPMTTQLEFTFGDDVSVLDLPVIERPFVPSRWDVVDGKVKEETA